ncbi:hypothetical protein [Paenibacillus vini]|uniref:Uncharacterized protein n=1 Tax=Paenibacillus vini TaxID=1476024 RepID=A0ABQ4MIV5_9BACL|nr:hypothetical protein [Paenibacillus vini]GIP55923.1 hypothetical protein J42TS3_49580 [Paenibacillus vini]
MRFVGIDPSTKTGLVILDEQGNVWDKKEIHLKNGIYSSSEELHEYGIDIVQSIPSNSVICIEGFSYGSKGKGVSTQYGVGFSIRFALADVGLKFIEVTPSQVKKFATGKGNTPKDGMVLPIYRNWGFEDNSDNIRDAFVLAEIARHIRGGAVGHKYQQEVVQAILEPSKPKKKSKAV